MRLIPSDQDASIAWSLGLRSLGRTARRQGRKPCSSRRSARRAGGRARRRWAGRPAGSSGLEQRPGRRARAMPRDGSASRVRDEPRRIAAATPRRSTTKASSTARDLLPAACDLRLDGAELLELAQAPAPLAPRLGRQPRGVSRLPARAEIAHRRLEPLDESGRALWQGREEPAGSRQAEEIREVVFAFEGGRCELRDDGLSVLAGGHERIGKGRPRPADELAHPQAETAPRAKRSAPTR